MIASLATSVRKKVRLFTASGVLIFVAFLLPASGQIETDWKDASTEPFSSLQSWQGENLDRITLSGDQFSFSGQSDDPNITLLSKHLFPGHTSYLISFEDLKFGTPLNNITAYFDIGFASDPKSMALVLRLTKFGDNGQLVYNQTSESLPLQPYIGEGHTSITMEYNSDTRRLLVTQTAGKYKDKEGNVQGIVENSPVVILDKVFAEPLDLGTSGTPLMISLNSQGNGGIDDQATLSNLRVQKWNRP